MVAALSASNTTAAAAGGAEEKSAGAQRTRGVTDRRAPQTCGLRDLSPKTSFISGAKVALG